MSCCEERKDSVRVSERGSTMVEATFTLLVFFLVTIVGIDLMRLAYSAVVGQYLAGWTVRQVVLGPNETCGQAARDARATCWIDELRTNRAPTFSIDYPANSISICSGSSNTAFPCGPDAGGARDFIIVQIRHNISILMGFGEYQITSLAIGKNEPFNAI